MFDLSGAGGGVDALTAVIVSLGELRADVDDSVRIDRIRALEELKSAAAAAQAAETALFAASQRAGQRASGVPAERASRGIASQVGLAKRLSPFHAARYVGWSAILIGELPRTFAALRSGTITEWRAMIVARETAWLSREHRAQVDDAVGPDLHQWGDRRVEAEVRKIAYRLDPTGYLGRIRTAVAERHVSLRPAPDTMARLTGVLPVAQAVAACAALKRHADTLVADGDGRSRGQIMADTLIERVTGQARAGDVSVEIQLLMSDETLLGETRTSDSGEAATGASAGASEPAQLIGYGPIPAAIARGLVGGVSDQTPMWVRRFYRDPSTGRLAAMDSDRRCFTAAQRRFITARDLTCRTPWCDAAIRHIDHVRPAEAGGPTDTANGQGYCAACNFARQAPGWHAITSPDGASDEVIITTPTGHRYPSRPPDPPGTSRRRSRVEPAARPRAA